MHSVDTVKTRQQAAPHILKYGSMGRAYWTIFSEEGIRGLYGGALPMLLGSGNLSKAWSILLQAVPGQMLFFSSYEYSKKLLVNAGMQDFMAYLTAGLIGDLFASAIYVPSEVRTRSPSKLTRRSLK
jgi:hypothetical protein